MYDPFEDFVCKSSRLSPNGGNGAWAKKTWLLEEEVIILYTAIVLH